jgi:hypothetical protein
MVAVAENLDHSVHDAHELAELAGQPVMAVIPVIATSREKLLRKMRMLAIPSGIIMVVVGGLVSVHFLYRPLNVLWIQLSHKLNLMF